MVVFGSRLKPSSPAVNSDPGGMPGAGKFDHKVCTVTVAYPSYKRVLYFLRRPARCLHAKFRQATLTVCKDDRGLI